VLDVRGRRDTATARVLVNATGPWLKLFATNVLRDTAPVPARLDKGSHIVVRRLFEHDRGYIFQTRDARVVFALPYQQDFTLIGTTDQGFAGDPGSVKPSANGDRLSLRRGEPAFPCDHRSRRRGLVVCRRALALRRRLPEGAGRYARLRPQAR